MLTRFARYRWQDHVPRPGCWKADLLVTVLFAAAVSTHSFRPLEIEGVPPGSRASASHFALEHGGIDVDRSALYRAASREATGSSQRTVTAGAETARCDAARGSSLALEPTRAARSG